MLGRRLSTTAEHRLDGLIQEHMPTCRYSPKCPLKPSEIQMRASLLLGRVPKDLGLSCQAQLPRDRILPGRPHGRADHQPCGRLSHSHTLVWRRDWRSGRTPTSQARVLCWEGGLGRQPLGCRPGADRLGPSRVASRPPGTSRLSLRAAQGQPSAGWLGKQIPL